MRVLLLLLVTTSAFAVEPFLVPEVPVAPYRAGARSQTDWPTIAAGPDGFFVAWRDYADVLEGDRVIGARISRDGTVLDPQGILLLDEAKDPIVRWDGDAYLLTCGPSYGVPTKAFRITPAGTVTETSVPAPEPRSLRNARGEYVEVASNPALLWFVSADGTRMNAIPIKGFQFISLVAAAPIDDDDWAVVIAAGGVRWLRVNRLGIVEEQLTDIPSDAYGYERTDPSQFMLTWQRSEALPGTKPPQQTSFIGSVTIDVRTGKSHLVTTDSKVTLQTTSPYSGVPVVDGSEIGMVWDTVDDAGDHEIRVLSGGRIRTLDRFHSSQLYAVTPQFATDGLHHAFAWKRSEDGFMPMFFSRIRRPWAIAVLPFERLNGVDENVAPIIVSRPSPTQRGPKSVAGANGVLVAWREMDGLARVAAKFVPWTGGPDRELAVSTTTALDVDADVIAVATAAQTYIVAWREIQWQPRGSDWMTSQYRILARRYDANGNAIDAAPIVIADEPTDGGVPSARTMSVVADDASFVVAWFGRYVKLYARRVPFAGAITRPPVVVSDDPPIIGPNLVRAGSRLYVLWASGTHDYVSLPKNETRWVKAARLDANLAPSAPITLEESTNLRLVDDIHIAAAANDQEVLLAFSTRTDIWDEHENACLKAHRFTFDLKPIDTPQLLMCNNIHDFPWNADTTAVAWDGQHWWVTAASVYGEEPMTTFRLNPNRTATALVLSERETRPIDPTVVRSPTGILAAYSRIDPYGGQTWRVFLRPVLNGISNRTRSARH